MLIYIKTTDSTKKNKRKNTLKQLCQGVIYIIYSLQQEKFDAKAH